MGKDKKDQTEELENVSGGNALFDFEFNCLKCSALMKLSECKEKYVGSGCGGHKEYQCPVCGEWNYFSKKQE